MHVVVDARYVGPQQSGIGHYTQQLVAHLVALDRPHRYTCVVARGGPGLGIASPSLVCWPTCIAFDDHLRGDLWLLAYLPFRLRRLRTDVFHGPAVFLPLVKVGYRTVVTVHDLVCFLFPETVPRRYSLYMRLMTWLAVRTADRIIAVSGATRDALVQRLGVEPARVAVIHEGVAATFARPPEQPGAVLRRLGIEPPYCLFVGNLEPRKNLVRLLEAFARLRAEGRPVRLVLAGARGWLAEPIFRAVERHGLADAVVFPGYVPAAELPALYAGAACFVFPSLYEGFGLPVLEAMAAGTPVVASRVGAIPEVAGDAALLVAPDQPAELAAAVASVLDDRTLRARLVERGRRRAAAFTWERAARETLAVYEAVHAGQGPG